jgi:hypothetical protein
MHGLASIFRVGPEMEAADSSEMFAPIYETYSGTS